MSNSMKEMISRMDQIDTPMSQIQDVVDIHEDNFLLAEWQQFKEQSTNISNLKPATPSPNVTAAMSRVSRVVPGMPPAAKVSQALQDADTSQQTGQPMNINNAQTLAQAQRKVGAAVLGATTQPGGGNITSTLSNIEQRTRFNQERAAKAAQTAAQAQGILK
jgi:hypothetical protein